MKLIGPQTSQVQSLGRHQSGLTAEAGKAAAIKTVTKGVSQTLETLAGAAEDILQTNTRRQSQQSELYMQKTDNDFWEQWGDRDFFDVSELPDEVVTEGMRVKGRVTSAEVLPHMYANFIKEELPKSSLIIENEKMRGEWLAVAQEVSLGRQQNIQSQADAQISKQILIDQNINRKNAIENKRPDVARQITNQMDISTDERKFNHMEEDAESEILTYEDLLLESHKKIPEILDEIEYLSRTNEVYRADNGSLDATSQLTWRNRLLAELANLRRASDASDKTNKRLIVDKANTFTSNLESGKLNRTEDITSMIMEIDLHPAREDLQLERDNLERAAVFNSQAVMVARQGSDTARKSYINNRKSSLPAPYGTQMALQLEVFNDRFTKNLSTDMMQTLIDAEIIPPLDIDVEGEPMDIANQLGAIRGIHDNAQSSYGYSQGYLPSQISKSLSERYNNMSVKDQLEFLSAANVVLGRDSSILFDQLRTDGTSSAKAIAGQAYAYGDTVGAKVILSGDELLKRRPEELRDLSIDLDAAFIDKVGMAFRGNPSHYEAVKDAYKAAYLGLAMQKGYKFDNVKSGTFFGLFGDDVSQEAFDIGTGGVIQHGDYAIAAPNRGVDQDIWDDWIDELHSDSIDAMGGVNGVSNIEFLRRIQDYTYSLEDTDKIGHYVVFDDVRQTYQQGKDGNLFMFKYDEKYKTKGRGTRQYIPPERFQ